jgi:hypothetical protein
MNEAELIARHDEQLKTLFTCQKKNEDTVGELWVAIKEIRDKLMYRPTWTVTIVVSILIAVTSISLTFAFTVIHGAIKYGIH